MSSNPSPTLPFGNGWFTCITCLIPRSEVNRNDFGDDRDLECMYCYKGVHDIWLQRRWCFKIRHSAERYRFFDLNDNGTISDNEHGICDSCQEHERKNMLKGPRQEPGAFEQWKGAVRKYTEWKEAAARNYAVEYGDLTEEEFKVMFPEEVKPTVAMPTALPKYRKPTAAPPKGKKEEVRSRARTPKEYILNKGSITVGELAAISRVSPVDVHLQIPKQKAVPIPSLIQPWRPGVIPARKRTPLIINISSDGSSSSDEDSSDNDTDAQQCLSLELRKEGDDIPASSTPLQATYGDLTYGYAPSGATVEDTNFQDLQEAFSACAQQAHNINIEQGASEQVRSTYGFDCGVCKMTRANTKLGEQDVCLYCVEWDFNEKFQMLWCNECKQEKVSQAFDHNSKTGDTCFECKVETLGQQDQGKTLDLGKTFLVRKDRKKKDDVQEDSSPQQAKTPSHKRTDANRLSWDMATVEAARKKRNIQGVKSMPQ